MRATRSAFAPAFTLLEILLVLAIIGLMATVLIGGSARMLNTKPATVDDVFWQSVQEARKGALRHERDVRLRFVDDRDKGKLFVVEDGDLTKEFPVPPAAASDDLSVDFLATQKGGPTILVAGVLMESQPVKYVTFYSDGTCSSFHVQIARNGSVHVLSIDPWTCAPVLIARDPNAPRT